MSTPVTAADVIDAARYTFFAVSFRKWSAAEQRQFLGANVFGKKDIKYDNAKNVFIVRMRVCYGSDYYDMTVTPEMVAECVNTGKHVCANGVGKPELR